MTPEEIDQMRRSIRQADPTSSSEPLSGNHIFRLTRNAMTTQDLPTEPRRSLRPRLLAAGAVAIVPLTLQSSAPAPQLVQPSTGGPEAVCVEVTPTVIASSDSAFRARVTSINGSQVTLRTIKQFVGDQNDEVEIPQGDGRSPGVDGSNIVFAKGKTYLLTVNDGVIAACGVSGEDSPALDRLYEAATQ